MSKDFYSNDHSIKVGLPNSLSGSLTLDAEESIYLKSPSSTVEVGTIIKVESGILAVGTSGNECSVGVFGPAYFKTENGNQKLESTVGDVNLVASSGTINLDSPNTSVTGNLSVAGNIIASGTVSGGSGISNAGDISIETTNGGNIILSATGFSAPLLSADIEASAANINLSSSNDTTIEADGILSLKSGTSSGDPSINLSKPLGSGLASVDSATISFSCTNFNLDGRLNLLNEVSQSYNLSSGYIMDLANENSGSTADILRLSFPNISSPTRNNHWIKFSANGTAKGSIQGASLHVGTQYALYSVNPSNQLLETQPGSAQFASGNEDFAEWIEIGDEAEWGITEEVKKELLQNSTFPVQEGIILYVRDSKVWKKSPGRGMVTTSRAAIIGNQNYKEDNKLGIILSFIGQVPVVVEGPVSDGDLLIPVGGKNHCKAIDPFLITFNEYKQAVGTAWGKKLTKDIGMVNCAIGVK
jgi:hypothetical protein